MRTMLVGAVLLLACLSGAARADEASAVKAVENLGGKVTRDDKLPGKPVIGVHLHEIGVTDAALKELADLKQLTWLSLTVTRVTDAGLKELKHLKQLNTLILSQTYVTGAGLKELTDLKQLTSLNLGGTRYTDETRKEMTNPKQRTWLARDVA